MRGGSCYSTIEHNLIKLSSLHDKWRIGIKSGLSVYSCLSYFDVLKWGDAFSKQHFPELMFSLHDVVDPAYLSPLLIPEKLRGELVPEVEHFMNSSWLCNESIVAKQNKANVEEYINLLKAPQDKTITKVKALAQSINVLDKIRKERTFDIFPKLHGWLKDV